MDGVIFGSATQMARAIRAQEVSSLEAVNACLERIASVNPQLNAVVQVRDEQARREAQEADAALARGEVKGLLHGVPMTIKDSFDTAGVITTYGTVGRASFVPEQDATVVARLRAAGAILLGKTNTPELTLSVETDNAVYGRTNNPYDLARTSGGSSGGAAAIVAAGGSPFDIGSDMAGSVRLPAHCCGIAGIRPTTGRVPRTGHMLPPGGLLDPLTQVGPMARSVEDLILILPIIAGVDWCDPAVVPMHLGDPDDVEVEELRIAVHTDNGILSPTREIVDTVNVAAQALSEAGATVVGARPDGIEQTAEIYRGLYFADDGETFRWFRERCGTVSSAPSTDGTTPTKSAASLTRLLYRASEYRSAMLSFMRAYDAILCPVSAFPALPHGTSDAGNNILSITYTAAYNLTGWPGAVVRCGTSPEGLPIGVQIVAHPWREDVALAVARHLERALGGWRPPQL